MKRQLLRSIGLILCVVLAFGLVRAQPSTEITYQGKLTDAGTPTTNYDFEFRLYDAVTGGGLYAIIERFNVPVTNGLFAVKLDFGYLFYTTPRYLEIAVRNVGGGAYTTLTPRQQVTPAPYALNSFRFSNWEQFRYIHNNTIQQTADLNISGWGYFGGTLGIGTPGIAEYKLEVAGRSRIRQNNGSTGTTNTAGLWLYQNAPAIDRAFIGMQDDNNVGFYGNNGAGWGLTMNTITGWVGIGTTPNDKLEVNGFMRVNQLSGGGTTQLCRNGANQLALCGSSLRYKTNIAPFFSGLSFIRQLRPITFDWIDGGMRDVGFGAEDVARIDPLFVTYNDKGEVEGVKYDRLSAVFVNAMKEQQAEIDSLKNQVAALSARLGTRKKDINLRRK